MVNDALAERRQRLNALAAEHLAGYRWMVATHSIRYYCPGHRFLMRPSVPPATVEFFAMREATGDEPAWRYNGPNYGDSLDAVAALEAIVLERGLAWEYVGTLAKLTDATAVLKDGPAAVTEHFWRYATAPAWVRLEACLRVCKVEVE